MDERLENFFDKDKESEDKEDKKKIIDANALEKFGIKELKSIILSLEWEITDQVMQKLGDETTRLEGVHRKDKIVVAFLQLLGSLGKYIRKKRAEAHPDSIRLLHDVYENLEEVMLSPQLSEAEKKKRLVSQVSQYKKLKDEITVAKPAAEKAETPESQEPSVYEKSYEETPVQAEPSVVSAGVLSPDDSVQSRISTDAGGLPPGVREVLIAMEEIRKTIQAEISALRAEFRQWREER